VRQRFSLEEVTVNLTSAGCWPTKHNPFVGKEGALLICVSTFISQRECSRIFANQTLSTCWKSSPIGSHHLGR